MKNKKTVLDLLAGKNRPESIDLAVEVLEMILGASETNSIRIVINEVCLKLRKATLPATDLVTYFKALIIAFQECLDTVIESARHREKFEHEQTKGVYDAAFVIAWIEAAEWFRANVRPWISGRSNSMMVEITNGLGKFIISTVATGGLVNFEQGLSGRLSNVSGPFVENFRCRALFTSLKEDPRVQSRLEHHSSHDDATRVIVQQLSQRAILIMSPYEQLNMLVAGNYDRDVPLMRG